MGTLYLVADDKDISKIWADMKRPDNLQFNIKIDGYNSRGVIGGMCCSEMGSIKIDYEGIVKEIQKVSMDMIIKDDARVVFDWIHKIIMSDKYRIELNEL